ncbi:MAG TPA: MBOAT family protein [Candidatus Mediterraneibacter merdipullorum]|nr:MBOAT family protein [Candidatus Mediterraneibacter merdipullorum]
MIFSSVFFIFVFLPITLLLYFVMPKPGKNLVLLICSLIFYAWGEPVYIVLMVFSIVYNYISGIEIDYHRRERNSGRMRFVFWLTVGVNLAILMFFKYYGFLMENINHILPIDIPYKELALPVGISFYTFQTLSYIIDVYKDNVKVQKNLINFGTYITMFPQLIAGPIVRYADIETQLDRRKITPSGFGNGIAWFLRGLGKKVLLANNIGMAYDAIAALPDGQMSVLSAWVGCIAYAFQIYFDFSGYSDMAIGLGKMFGFEFMKNFDYPYISKSITEFWRRWHISLGTWFREYVYIPLGGNRGGTLKAIRNIFIVWFLTGFWHGAAWNFIFWGLYYGVLLLLEKYVLNRVLEKLPSAVKHIYTMLFVLIGWVLFFSPGMGDALSYIGAMFGIGANGFADAAGIYYLYNYALLFVIAAICSVPFTYRLFSRTVFGGRRGKGHTAVAMGVYVAIFVLSLAYLVNATYNPFLYFRF